MFVSDILAQKGGLVFTVSPGTTVAQAAQHLSIRRIGSVLVMDGTNTIAGIVSERDLVRAMARHGGDALDLEVAAGHDPRGGDLPSRRSDRAGDGPDDRAAASATCRWRTAAS